MLFRSLLLLLLRCLVIIIISFILAEPVWKRAVNPEKGKAWILVERGSFAEARSQFRQQFDSLLAIGSELHYLEPGFPETDSKSSLIDTLNTATTKKFPYFSLIKLLEENIPAGSNAYLFTGNQINRFKGDKPQTTKIGRASCRERVCSTV